jgi:hypothetical protein
MKPPQMFVSHSKKDTNIRAFFDQAFARTGVKSECMEFEDMQPPHWNEIDKQIQDSLATFLLLGPNVKNSDHTQNWIAFEVGLSCAHGKRVWVFERMKSKINFPIPYVTDYMPYVLDRFSFDYIRGIIESYRDKTIREGLETECRYCHSVFFTHHIIGAYHCPVCREYSIPKK